MYVMHPVSLFFERLDGFETAAFWIASFTAVVIAGFLVDYILQKQGFGVIVNSALIVVGIFAGLYVRFAYAKPGVVPLADPMLTVAVILGVTTLLLGGLALVRNRFY